jgi:hypothetical protein
LRADPDDEDIPTTNHDHTIKVRKPSKSEFFRVRPEEEYTLDVRMIEVGDGIETEKYIVLPQVARDAEVLAETTRRRLFVCVNRAGARFIWPAKLPSSDRKNDWTDTALDIAESAKKYWVRMVPDTVEKCYVERRAESLQEEPRWKDLTLMRMLELGFKNKIISDYDHEVLRRLRGEL